MLGELTWSTLATIMQRQTHSSIARRAIVRTHWTACFGICTVNLHLPYVGYEWLNGPELGSIWSLRPRVVVKHPLVLAMIMWICRAPASPGANWEGDAGTARTPTQRRAADPATTTVRGDYSMDNHHRNLALEAGEFQESIRQQFRNELFDHPDLVGLFDEDGRAAVGTRAGKVCARVRTSVRECGN